MTNNVKIENRRAAESEMVDVYTVYAAKGFISRLAAYCLAVGIPFHFKPIDLGKYTNETQCLYFYDDPSYWKGDFGSPVFVTEERWPAGQFMDGETLRASGILKNHISRHKDE